MSTTHSNPGPRQISQLVNSFFMYATTPNAFIAQAAELWNFRELNA